MKLSTLVGKEVGGGGVVTKPDVVEVMASWVQFWWKVVRDWVITGTCSVHQLVGDNS